MTETGEGLRPRLGPPGRVDPCAWALVPARESRLAPIRE